MSEHPQQMKFTGEYFVPGTAADRIEADHLERYRFASGLARGKRVLDAACGVGYGSAALMDGGAQSYQGVDINADLVAHAQKTYGGPDVQFRLGDVTALGFQGEFDLITSFETIEHVPDYKGALASLYKALKPGGEMLVSSPDRRVTSPNALELSSPPQNEFHTQEFTPAELLRELGEAGFSVKDGDIYGQRIRRFLPRSVMGRLSRRLFSSPDEAASPQPRLLKGKIGRYFIIRATKEVE